MALADDLLALSRVVAPAGVPGVPGLHVRSLSVEDVLRLRQSGDDGIVLSVLLGASDAGGVRVFADGAEADVRALAFNVVARISEAVLAFNGMVGGEVTEGKAPAGTP